MSTDRPETYVATEGVRRPRHLAFVGRAAELAALNESTRPGVAVSLFGPPGVGKSRLVSEFVAARRSVGKQWIVIDLHDCARGGEFELRVAEALRADACGLRVDSVAGRLGALCGVRGLEGVVFDGFDRLVPEANLIAQWQSAAEDTSTLVVSRARLPTSVARGIRLEPMPLDDALELFADRAREARASFRLEETREEVTEIVRRLDRLPLAIEMAAARMNILDPPAMLARLSHRFKLLESTSTGQLATFEEAIDWSWKMLSPEQRAAVDACARFVAPFTLEAAEAVIGDGTLRIVDELVSAAWLQVSSAREDESLRFAMLESLRAFAASRPASGEETAEDVDGRFVSCHIDLVARLCAMFETPSAREALERLDRERENVERALELGLRHRPEVTLEALWSLRPFLLRRAASGAYAVIEKAVEVAEKVGDEALLARSLCVLGEVAFVTGRSRRASDALERSFGIARGLDDQQLLAEVARASSLPLARLDVELGAERLQIARDAAQNVNDPVLRARILERQGYIHLQKFQLAEAEQKFEEARTASALVGNHLYSAGIVSGLAYVALRRGRYEEALAAFDEAVRLQEDYGGAARQAGARYNLAVALHSLGETKRAREQLQSAREVWEELGLGELLGLAHLLAGVLALEQGEYHTADAAFRAAIAAARDAGDTHNRALAEGWWGLSRSTADLTRGPIGLLEDSVAALDHVRAPDAAAALLATLVSLYASNGDADSAARTLDRLESIESWLSDEDRHLRQVLSAIGRIGQMFDTLQTPTASQAQALLKEELGLGSAPDAWRAAVTKWPNPFVRDLLRRVVGLAAPANADEDRFELDPNEFDVVLEIHRGGHWFQIDDDGPVDLLMRRAIRQITACLLEKHLETPHTGVSVKTLIDAGWPGELMTDDSGKTRVYSAVRILRELGMRDLLVTDDAGYHFAEGVGVRPTDEPFPS